MATKQDDNHPRKNKGTTSCKTATNIPATIIQMKGNNKQIQTSKK